MGALAPIRAIRPTSNDAPERPLLVRASSLRPHARNSGTAQRFGQLQKPALLWLPPVSISGLLLVTILRGEALGHVAPISRSDEIAEALFRFFRVRSVRLILRQTERDYARAIEARAHTENNAKQAVQVRRHLARLEPEALARVSHHLDAVHGILRESGGTTDGRLFAWTSAIVPLSNTGGIQS